MKLKIYAYHGCGTCRKALQYLESRGMAHTVVLIRETPPSVTELRRMLRIYDGDFRRLFNTSGLNYKRLELKNQLPSMTPEQAIRLLASNGNLVK